VSSAVSMSHLRGLPGEVLDELMGGAVRTKIPCGVADGSPGTWEVVAANSYNGYRESSTGTGWSGTFRLDGSCGAD
jgi:hypothetical protein